MDSRCCYGESLRAFEDARQPHEVTWKIRVRVKTPSQISHSGKNNFTLLKKEDMEFLLDYCRSTYDIDFGFTIEEPGSLEDQSRNYYLVTISLNRRKTEQKFVLTWIRHFYEFPFNMFMLDALKLKNEVNELSGEHILNLLQLIGSTYSFVKEDYILERTYRTDQCFCLPNKKFVTVNKVKKSNAEKDLITSAWNISLSRELATNLIHYKSETESEVETTQTLEYWQNPDNWEERKQAYLNNYKIYRPTK